MDAHQFSQSAGIPTFNPYQFAPQTQQFSSLPGQFPGQFTSQFPGQFTGQFTGQFPGQFTGQLPGQLPGQFAGQLPGQFGSPFSAGQFAQQPGAPLSAGSNLQPFFTDPASAAYAQQLQQAQLAQQLNPQQGFFGAAQGAPGQAFGGTPSQLFTNPAFAQQGAQQFGRLPFQLDPTIAALAQQLQLQQAQLAQLAQQFTPPYFGNPLAQQFAPQGFQSQPLAPFGNAIGSIYGTPAWAAANPLARFAPFAPFSPFAAPGAAPLLH